MALITGIDFGERVLSDVIASPSLRVILRSPQVSRGDSGDRLKNLALLRTVIIGGCSATRPALAKSTLIPIKWLSGVPPDTHACQSRGSFWNSFIGTLFAVAVGSADSST